MSSNNGKKGILRRIKWMAWGVPFVVGILFWAGFNWGLDTTNTEPFCTSCHSMQINYQEYRNTVHAQNASGVLATCQDCHVPKAFWPKIGAKIRASNDLWHWMLGSIETEEKFEGKRAELAQRVWDRYQATDSRECRSCHTETSFDFMVQGRRAVQEHQSARDAGQTCIECHKGIAHKLPRIDQGIGVEGGIAPEVFHPASN